MRGHYKNVYTESNASNLRIDIKGKGLQCRGATLKNDLVEIEIGKDSVKEGISAKVSYIIVSRREIDEIEAAIKEIKRIAIFYDEKEKLEVMKAEIEELPKYLTSDNEEVRNTASYRLQSSKKLGGI